MLRPSRIWLAGTLAVAIACVPLVLDQCAAMCEAHNQSAVTSPNCHHASASTGGATGPHWGHSLGTCGHDHDTVVTADSGTIRLSRTLLTTAALVPDVMAPVV